MQDKQVKLKLGWFNIFNVGGALYGWHLSHTWEGAAWGYAGGTLLPIGFVLSVFLCICLLNVVEGISSSVRTRYRVATESQRIETDEERWVREYAEHCKAEGLPNELQESYREMAAPIHGDYEFIRHTTSGGGPG